MSNCATNNTLAYISALYASISNTGSIPVVATIQSEENSLFSSDFVLPLHSTTPVIILQKAQNTTKSDSVPCSDSYLLPFNPYACVSTTDSSRSVEGCLL